VRPALRTPVFVVANVLGLGAFLWPFLLPAVHANVDGAHGADAPVIMVALLLALGFLLFVELGRGGMGPKTVALIGVLGAAMVALRLPGFVAGFSAIFIVVLVAGNAFGPGFGFLLGALGTFASGLFVGGLGPWLPFQMVAVGWVGAGAGLVPRGGPWPQRIGWLAAYGIVSGFAFGALTDLWFWPFAAGLGRAGWVPQGSLVQNLAHFGVFYVTTSLLWDAFRAGGNALLVVLTGRPLLAALDRAARRMGSGIVSYREPAGRPRPDLVPAEESPGSIGQSAGVDPRRGDPRKVPQKQTAG
jgi:energy-coupling factor transport system substrate-specific component